MEKSERPKASRREDGIDLISNMPDHILLLILSRLKSTEEVIRSSILSRRWRYLWTSIPSLYIRCFRKDSLKEAEIEPKLMDNTISVFSGISQVESLLIDVNFFTQCINTAFDPSLPNLKTLVLSTTIGAFTMEEFNRILKYYPKLESLKLIVIEELWREEQEVHEGDPRSIFTNDVKRVEIFELNGEKPKLVIDLEEKVLLEIVFSWGKKFKYSH
ncbi:putative F-box/LRR-repeat protein At3g28410 isoform X4 [Lactuca sativa]|uniref:putative F-box/LRR-repeat protein At3g28410 isoform X4 n=1 Tax=Lactuca sativa TaxID=4236 RepID=UPI000CAA1D84|nr:putative F-box/LRR-repeat protein At3g28410 isoform X4 [Lactuca sativa]